MPIDQQPASAMLVTTLEDSSTFVHEEKRYPYVRTKIHGKQSHELSLPFSCRLGGLPSVQPRGHLDLASAAAGLNRKHDMMGVVQ